MNKQNCIDICDDAVAVAVHKLQCENSKCNQGNLVEMFCERYHCNVNVNIPYSTRDAIEFDEAKYKTLFLLQFAEEKYGN